MKTKITKVLFLTIVIGFFITTFKFKVFADVEDDFQLEVVDSVYLTVNENGWTEFKSGNPVPAAESQLMGECLFIRDEDLGKYYIDYTLPILGYYDGFEYCYASNDIYIEYDKDYKYFFHIETDGSYCLNSENISVYINECEVIPEYIEYDGAGYYLIIDVECEPGMKMDPFYIGTVTISGVPEVVPNNIAFDLFECYDITYSILSAQWSCFNSPSFRAGDSFMPGETYTLSLVFEPIEGYEFASHPGGEFAGMFDCGVEFQDASFYLDQGLLYVECYFSTEDFREDIVHDLSASLSVDKTVANIGDEVNLQVNVFAGSGSYMYTYRVLNVDTGELFTLTEYTDSDTYKFKLNYPGKKQFEVIVEDSWGNIVTTEAVEVEVLKPLDASLKYNNSTKDVIMKKRSNINLSVNAINGSGSYTYKFAVLNVDTGKWSVLRDFSDKSTLTYALNYTGRKQFAVTVKDSTGKTVATNRLSVNVLEVLPSVELFIDGSSVLIEKTMGDLVKLEANAMNFKGDCTYKFVVHNLENDSWYTLKDYSKESEYVTKFSSEGRKEFVVSVKDSTGTIVASKRIMVIVKNDK